jgi:hypothetical protein
MEHNTHLKILDQLIPKSWWGTPKHTALLNKMGIDSVLVTKCNLIQIQFDLHHFKGTVEETGLLNTGATESFIDHKAITCLNWKLRNSLFPNQFITLMVQTTKAESSRMSATSLLPEDTSKKEYHSTSPT